MVFSVEIQPDTKVVKMEENRTQATSNPTGVSNHSSVASASSQPLNISSFLFDQLFPSLPCQRGLHCVPETSCQVALRSIIAFKILKIIIIIYENTITLIPNYYDTFLFVLVRPTHIFEMEGFLAPSPHCDCQKEFEDGKTLLMATSSNTWQYNQLLSHLKVSAKDLKQNILEILAS